VPSSSRIGVLGSLCNPPHLGHAALARIAAEQLDLECVLLVPTGVPAHREPPAVSAGMRLRLAQAAAADEPVLLASSVEVERSGPSYMADTLEQLARAAGDAELFLLLGADQYATLDEWHDPERVRSLATISVAPRPGIEIAADSATLIAMPEMDVASSEIRRRIGAGESIDGMVSPSVAALIAAEGLYQSGGAG